MLSCRAGIKVLKLWQMSIGQNIDSQQVEDDPNIIVYSTICENVYEIVNLHKPAARWALKRLSYVKWA